MSEANNIWRIDSSRHDSTSRLLSLHPTYWKSGGDGLSVKRNSAIMRAGGGGGLGGGWWGSRHVSLKIKLSPLLGSLVATDLKYSHDSSR